LNLGALGIDPGSSFEVYDEMTGSSYTWTGDRQYVRLDPTSVPGHVFHVRPH
jgi:starch synthase (maltosyl-transferring)